MDQQVLNIHEELIERCRGGERSAFYSIYKLYSKAMYNLCYRITNDQDDASDALQEAFISAFNNLDSYRGDATFGAWLKRIVVNKAINVLKKRRFETLPEDEHWDVAEETRQEELQYGELTVQTVKTAIQQLPEGYRAVLSLYLLEGYDHQEIGEILGVSESTSKSQLNRAKKKLREILTQKL